MLAGGFEFTEGPLWCPDGSLLFQDIRAERTYRLQPDRSVALVRERTGAANGQTFAADGRISTIAENTTPHSLAIVSSKVPVGAILELKGGEAARRALHAGDKVTWTRPQ